MSCKKAPEQSILSKHIGEKNILQIIKRSNKFDLKKLQDVEESFLSHKLQVQFYAQDTG